MTASGVEVKKILECGTIEEIEMPYGKTLISLMWVFSYKFDDAGYLLKFKARLVVRGDRVPDNGKRMHSDTLAARTARVMLAIMAILTLVTRHFDGVNAFLNGFLEEDEQYICYCPQGFSKQGKAWKLLHPLYGLPRSPYLWFAELSGTLKSLGFRPILESQCILTNGRVIVFFYVDDIVVLNRKEHRKEADEVITLLKEKYEFRNMGDLQWFLGIRVTRDGANRRVYLTQDAHMDKIVKEYKLGNGPHVTTPLSMDSASAYRPYKGTASEQEIKSYQRRVGSVIYPAFLTRPDIAHAASLLPRFMQNPSPFHSSKLDRAICYLRDTKELSIVYDGLV